MREDILQHLGSLDNHITFLVALKDTSHDMWEKQKRCVPSLGAQNFHHCFRASTIHNLNSADASFFWLFGNFDKVLDMKVSVYMFYTLYIYIYTHRNGQNREPPFESAGPRSYAFDALHRHLFASRATWKWSKRTVSILCRFFGSYHMSSFSCNACVLICMYNYIYCTWHQLKKKHIAEMASI